ncbi:unnamed protein product, partial [Ixodes pacificus]
MSSYSNQVVVILRSTKCTKSPTLCTKTDDSFGFTRSQTNSPTSQFRPLNEDATDDASRRHSPVVTPDETQKKNAKQNRTSFRETNVSTCQRSVTTRNPQWLLVRCTFPLLLLLLSLRKTAIRRVRPDCWQRGSHPTLLRRPQCQKLNIGFLRRSRKKICPEMKDEPNTSKPRCDDGMTEGDDRTTTSGGTSRVAHKRLKRV